MKLRCSALCALFLSVGISALGAADAQAAFIRRSVVKTTNNYNGSTYHRVATTVSGDAGAVAAVTAELHSDAGEEQLSLVESNAWLHGAATIGALPTTDAGLSLTLLDANSAPLMSFSGILSTDGSVRFWADTAVGTGDCTSRSGCTGTDPRATGPDIEVLAAELFPGLRDGYPDSAGSYELALDLAGADTYTVAYASLSVTESSGELCVSMDRAGNCLLWQTGEVQTTRSEVFWDDVGSVWEADTAMVHTGVVALKVKVFDAGGERLEVSKAALGLPLQDGGEGVATVATDEDPLTLLALHRPRQRAFHPGRRASYDRVHIYSRGWTAGTALPVDAEVELTNGDTITIPVNSYQRHIGGGSVIIGGGSTLGGDSTITITGGNVEFRPLGLGDLNAPVCSAGLCVTLLENERGEPELAVTAYAEDAATLPESLALSITLNDGLPEELVVDFDDEIVAVFGNEISLLEDPLGLCLSGKIKLLGEPNRRGRQETLSKGKFSGALSRDDDGDLELAGADKAALSSGEIVEAGEPLLLGAEETPPLVSYMGSATGGRPELVVVVPAVE